MENKDILGQATAVILCNANNNNSKYTHGDDGSSHSPRVYRAKSLHTLSHYSHFTFTKLKVWTGEGVAPSSVAEKRWSQGSDPCRGYSGAMIFTTTALPAQGPPSASTLLFLSLKEAERV